MKKISVAKMNRELTALNCDPASRELMLTNVKMLNDLIQKYNDDTIGRDIYLMSQLNSIIIKALESLRKTNAKVNPVEEEDGFMTMIKTIKDAK